MGQLIIESILLLTSDLVYIINFSDKCVYRHLDEAKNGEHKANWKTEISE